MLGMEATPSAAALIWIVGNLKTSLVQDLPDDLPPDVVVLRSRTFEQLGGVPPQGIDCSLRTSMRFLRAVAEPYHPRRCVEEVIAGLLERTAGDAGQRRVVRSR